MNAEKKSTASSVMAELCGDEAIVKAVEANLARTRLVTIMTAARVRKNMTQKEVADKIGTSVSKVSRLEASDDDDLKLGDVKSYLCALGLETSIAVFDKSLPTASRIKHCVFEIERLLNHLTSLARGCEDDKEIVDGIARFRGEVLFNFLIKYMSSGKDFPVMYLNEDEASDLSAEEEPIKHNINEFASCRA